MVYRRAISRFVLLLIGNVLSVDGAVAGPKLPPAPYKPLPIGTVLDYGWWKCRVEASDGLDTVCTDGGRRAQLFGKFIVHDDLDEDGYGGATPVVPIAGYAGVPNDISVTAISMTADARRAIR